MLKNLISLLQKPETSIEAIQAELGRIKKESKQPLSVLLNQGDEANRPLQVAVQYAHPAVISLLLEHDCQITKETNKFLQGRIDGIPEITALLDFYGYLQSQAFQPDFPFGQTIALIKEAMTQLEPLRAVPRADKKEAVVVIGATGVGKSTLCNIFEGIEYNTNENQDGDEILVLANPQQPEPFKTSSRARSETSYPGISTNDTEPFCIVDMPGYDDTRGIAQQISVGLGAEGLYDCFDKLRALAVVCLRDNIFKNPRDKSFQDTLKTTASIIKQNEEQLKRIIFIVNRSTVQTTAARIKEKLEEILKANPDFPEELKFLLEGIQEDQIMLVKESPGKQVQKEFIERLQALQAQDFQEFNFSTYNSEFACFRRLLIQLINYKHEVHAEGLALINATTPLVLSDEKKIKDTLKVVTEKSKEVPTQPAHLEDMKLVLTKIQQQMVRGATDTAIVLAVCQTVIAQLTQLRKDFSTPHPLVKNVTGDLNSVSAIWKHKNRVINEFFVKLDPILKRLNLDSDYRLMGNYGNFFGAKAPANDPAAPADKPVAELKM